MVFLERTLSAALLLLVTSGAWAEYSIDDAVLFSIKFPGKPGSADAELSDLAATATSGAEDKPKGEEAPETPLEERTTPLADAFKDSTDLPMETLTMRTRHSEEYECTLPDVAAARRAQLAREEPYTGPNALEILQQLFLTQTCTYRLEHYWTYELCHGMYLRQYHEERDGKDIKLTEYYLGKYSAETFTQEVTELRKNIAAGTARKPRTKRIEVLNMPYYELMMRDGTKCDISGLPRVTRVNYVCYPAGKNEMYSFKESSTCEYDVIVLSPQLCQHPDYRPQESNELTVQCRPKSDNAARKPLDMIKMDTDNLLARRNSMLEGTFTAGDKPGTVKIDIRPYDQGETDASMEDAADRHRDSNWRKGNPRQPFKPLMDPQVVKEFLMGEYCLYGGTGWWKYEFCYGKKVDQYHEDRGGQRTVINLGRFDEADHVAWLEKNPTKRPKPVNMRKSVSHFYAGGDLCDVTKRPRQVEVRLKCKESDSPSTVSLYLLEPKTCEYVLGVESPLVCDILHLADENGKMEIDFNQLALDDPSKSSIDSESASTSPNSSPATSSSGSSAPSNAASASAKDAKDKPSGMDSAATDADYLFPMTFTTADGKKIIVKQAGDVLHVEEMVGEDGEPNDEDAMDVMDVDILYDDEIGDIDDAMYDGDGVQFEERAE